MEFKEIFGWTKDIASLMGTLVGIWKALTARRDKPSAQKHLPVGTAGKRRADRNRRFRRNKARPRR